MEEQTIFSGKIIITPLVKATQALHDALEEAKTQLERDGTIQRFEFTYELLWETLKKILLFKGIDANNPRDVFREAAKNHLIEDPNFWFEVIQKRNLTSGADHYDQTITNEIFNFLPQFESALVSILGTIKKPSG